jgi:hypothetical protein
VARAWRLTRRGSTVRVPFSRRSPGLREGVIFRRLDTLDGRGHDAGDLVHVGCRPAGVPFIAAG